MHVHIVSDIMGHSDLFSSRWVQSILILCVTILVIIAIVIISSFSYLDFYDYGFSRRKTTGQVDLSRVYESGRYFRGPDHV